MDFWKNLIDGKFIIFCLGVMYYTYILLLMITSTRSVFRSAFFRIFIVTGFFDIMGVIAIIWIGNDLKIGFGPQFELISRIASVLTATNFFTHIIGCLLMTLNRYMAACHPARYDTIWSPRLVWVWLLVDIVVSYGANAQLFFVAFVYEWRNDTWVLLGRERAVPESRVIVATGAIIYEVLGAVLIARTLYVIRKTIPLKSRKGRQDLGLLMVTAIDCLLGVLECIYEVSAIVGVSKVNSPIIYLINQNYDCYLFLIMTMNSYSVMFLSSQLRYEAFRACRRVENTTTVTVNNCELTSNHQNLFTRARHESR